MIQPHCSKCCPVKPPAPEVPSRLAPAAWVWLAGVLAMITGGWALIVWLGASLWR